MNIRKCFVKEYQGHRWLFKKQEYGDNFDMIDELGEFLPIQLTPAMAELLASQLGILQTYQDDDKKHLLFVNMILEFISENKNLDKDIMIALIENWDKVVRE